MKLNWYTGLTPARIGILAHSPALCFCYACGNPRKYSGESRISELRVIEAMKFEIDNL